jgi:uncharacterized protein
MRRFYSVLTMLLIIVLPGYLYLGFRLAGDRLGWMALAVPFLLVLSFSLRWGFSNKDETSWLAALFLQLTFICMGLLSFLLALTLIRDLAWFAAGLWVSNLTVVTIAIAAFLFGTFWASGPSIKRRSIPIEGLPRELHGLRIAHISDLHVGPSIGRRYVEKVVRKANSIQPDIVALTGDFGDGPAAQLKEHIEPLGKLKASAGIYYVPGNHEYYWNVEDWISVIKDLGAAVLLNRSERIQFRGAKLLIGGVTDPAAPYTSQHPAPDVKSAHGGPSDAALKILLSHRPSMAAEASKLGFHLQLSGHTHGGQFFPWTIVVRFVHKFFLGLHKHENMWIYVNGGTGSWGPLLRLGTTPEITHIELIAADQKA